MSWSDILAPIGPAPRGMLMKNHDILYAPAPATVAIGLPCVPVAWFFGQREEEG